MDPLSEIREKIKRIANGNGSFTCFTAKVTSVDGETCDVELEGMKLTDVRLRGNNTSILWRGSNNLRCKDTKFSHTIVYFIFFLYFCSEFMQTIRRSNP